MLRKHCRWSPEQAFLDRPTQPWWPRLLPWVLCNYGSGLPHLSISSRCLCLCLSLAHTHTHTQTHTHTHHPLIHMVGRSTNPQVPLSVFLSSVNFSKSFKTHSNSRWIVSKATESATGESAHTAPRAWAHTGCKAGALNGLTRWSLAWKGAAPPP